MADVKQLMKTFVVTGPDLGAVAVDVTDTFWSDLDEQYDDFAGRTLVSSFEFTEAWPTWEMHPAGDEIVVLIDGDVEMTLALPGGDETVHLDEPGQFVIVPRATWHTAVPQKPTRMLFVTPGEGTENREQPVRGAD